MPPRRAPSSSAAGVLRPSAGPAPRVPQPVPISSRAGRCWPHCLRAAVWLGLFLAFHRVSCRPPPWRRSRCVLSTSPPLQWTGLGGFASDHLGGSPRGGLFLRSPPPLRRGMPASGLGGVHAPVVRAIVGGVWLPGRRAAASAPSRVGRKGRRKGGRGGRRARLGSLAASRCLGRAIARFVSPACVLLGAFSSDGRFPSPCSSLAEPRRQRRPPRPLGSPRGAEEGAGAGLGWKGRGTGEGEGVREPLRESTRDTALEARPERKRGRQGDAEKGTEEAGGALWEARGRVTR